MLADLSPSRDRLGSSSGTGGKPYSTKDSTLVMGEKVETGTFSCRGLAAAPNRYGITARICCQMGSHQLNVQRQISPAMSSVKGRLCDAGTGTSLGPATLL
ncbi:hypothetical protein ATANTOWER_013709 [Ataeniobius toweri]|uniref:Uncharacterized protein n=1 Tax=Ataeniobius toweri TaxID=208326 RepID=A0ABU7CB22_9TELE|nr:hypothetical protein [Ataeniobius toweri]